MWDRVQRVISEHQPAMSQSNLPGSDLGIRSRLNLIGLHHVAHATHSTHAAHSAHATAAMMMVVVIAALIFLGLLNHDAISGQEENGNFRGILQSSALDFGRGNDACFNQVHVLAGQGVVSFLVLGLHDPPNHHAAAGAGVFGDLLEWGNQRLANDLHAGRFIAFQLEIAAAVERLERPDQGNSAAWDDAFFNRSAGCVQGIFNPRLLLLQLGLGRGSDADLGNSTGQLCKPLLELFPVIVTGGDFDLAADLLDPTLDRIALAGTFNDRGVVVVDRDFLGLAQTARSRPCPTRCQGPS